MIEIKEKTEPELNKKIEALNDFVESILNNFEDPISLDYFVILFSSLYEKKKRNTTFLIFCTTLKKMNVLELKWKK